jgi:hypothetical protein
MYLRVFLRWMRTGSRNCLYCRDVATRYGDEASNRICEDLCALAERSSRCAGER